MSYGNNLPLLVANMRKTHKIYCAEGFKIFCEITIKMLLSVKGLFTYYVSQNWGLVDPPSS